MNELTLSPKGATFLRLEEGFVDHWYPDPVGRGTLGVGFTWASDGFREWWARNRPHDPFGPGATMSRAEADRALTFICQVEYGKDVNRFFGRAVKQHIFDGTVSPVYNMGSGSLKWKWAAALKSGDVAEASLRLRSTGTTANGKPLRGLINRRKEEAELLLNGDYTIGNSAKDALSDGVLVRRERGAPVADLQTKLAALGFYTGSVDGRFGYGTEAAVLEFQRSRGLTADGYAGPLTLAALASPPKPSPAPSTPPKPETPPAPAKWSLLGAIIAFILSLFKGRK